VDVHCQCVLLGWEGGGGSGGRSLLRKCNAVQFAIQPLPKSYIVALSHTRRDVAFGQWSMTKFDVAEANKSLVIGKVILMWRVHVVFFVMTASTTIFTAWTYSKSTGDSVPAIYI
jgi:hypothetical protein